jgi:hypothetical protein
MSKEESPSFLAAFIRLKEKSYRHGLAALAHERDPSTSVC